MSRSSLDRGANRMQQRKLANESVVLAAHEEGGGRKGDIAIHGSTTTFNLNSLLHKNIVQSPYFVKLCEKVTDWKALVDEIYNKVSTRPGGLPDQCNVNTAMCHGPRSARVYMSPLARVHGWPAFLLVNCGPTCSRMTGAV